MTYKVKDDVTREQLVALVEALNPFYAFGAVLSTANTENGFANVTLYAGKPEEVKENKYGVKWADIPYPEDDDCEISLDEIDPEGCLFTVVGTWSRLPASYMGPTLKAKHFFAARDAFTDCIENKETPNDKQTD